MGAVIFTFLVMSILFVAIISFGKYNRYTESPEEAWYNDLSTFSDWEEVFAEN